MKHTAIFLAIAAFALSAQAVEYPRDEIIPVAWLLKLA